MALQGLLCSIDSFLSFVARFVSFRFVSSRLVSSRLVYGVIKWYVQLKSLLKIYHNKRQGGCSLNSKSDSYLRTYGTGQYNIEIKWQRIFDAE